MVYPFYVHYDLPSCCVLLLSWFGNKLSIQYILNLSSANYPYFWSLFFVYLCQIIWMHARYYSTHELPHQNPVTAHKCLQGRPYIRISSALQRLSHNYLCFHGSQILYAITVNIRIRASEEYCGTLQWLTKLAPRHWVPFWKQWNSYAPHLLILV